jgi:DNA-binding CsgD family transcriptional regulator/tetratricopeptide (TPR) repeat protein
MSPSDTDPGATELLERDEPLAAFAEWLTQAGSGAGRMVLVSGEAGIGKTSLMREVRDQHRDDIRVWWGACDALNTPRPLGPLHDIGRVARGRVGALLASDVPRHARFSGFLDALDGPLQPTLVVIEDVHWADEATRDLLVFLARRIGDARALVAVTYRDDEVGARHPLRRVLGALATLPSVERWSLSPLSTSAVTRLAGRGTDIDELMRITRGNPFFVTEALASGSASIPATVSDAVLARLHRVSEPARRVAEALSVLPNGAEMALVLEVSGAAGSAVQECIDVGLLDSSEGWLTFRHELARMAVGSTLPATSLPDLHAAILRWMEHRPDPEHSRLAFHAGAARDDAAILEHAPRAAVEARELGAHREAVAFLEMTLRLAGAVDPDQVARWRLWLASELEVTDDAEGARRERTRVVEHYRATGDPVRLARTLLTLARSGWYTKGLRGAERAIDEAVQLLDPLGPSPDLVRALWYRGYLGVWRRRYHEAMRFGMEASQMAERLDLDVLAARAMHLRGDAELTTGDPDRGVELLNEAADRLAELEEFAHQGHALIDLGVCATEVRRHQDAARALREAERLGRRHDHDLLLAVTRAAQGWLAFQQGRWSEVDDRTRWAVDVPEGSSVLGQVIARTAAGRAGVRRGDPEGIDRLHDAVGLAGGGFAKDRWPVACGLAEAAWLEGQPDRIPDLLAGVAEDALAADSRWGRGEVGFWLWRAGEISVSPEGAAEPFALQMAGDWRGAAAAWEEIGCPYEVAVALADGDDPDALRRALTILGELGAAPMADRVAARLRSLGVRDLPRRPSRATVDNPGGLTARQLEVLALLVEGRTNPEIAASLHISPKTAGHHVSAILTKLGVNDRHAAARTAREQGLAPG